MTSRPSTEPERRSKRSNRRVRSKGYDPESDYRVVTISAPKDNPFKFDTVVIQTTEKGKGLFDGTDIGFVRVKGQRKPQMTTRSYFFWGKASLKRRLESLLKKAGATVRGR